MKKEYVLGLDLGTNSIGWACVDFINQHIISGVRIFDIAENPKDGRSLAEPRRIARLTRRRLYRRWVRLQKTKDLLIKHGFINQQEDIQSAYPANIWALRVKALDELLSNQELSRVIYHIVKARGFKSSRKEAVSEDKELTAANADMNNLVLAFQESTGNRTIAEYLYNTYGLKHKNIRNKFGSYTHLIKQDLNENELKLILNTQKEKGNKIITDVFIEELFEVFHYRKGLPSFESKVGSCELEPKYKRAPKDSVSASLFRAWSDLNNLRISSADNELSQSVSLEKRKALIELAFEKANEGKKITETQIKNILEVAMIEQGDSKGKKYLMNLEMKKILQSLTFSSYIKLKPVLEELKIWDQVKDNIQVLDSIIYAIAYLKEFKNYSTLEDPIIKELLGTLNWHESIWETLFDTLSFDGTMGHSLQAMWHIQPYLQQEELCTYDKALEAAYPNHFNNRDSANHNYLPKFDEENFTNPVVRRTLNQARLLINKIISLYGKPQQINIELARGLGKTKADRNKIEQEMKENQAKNEQYRAICAELRIPDPIIYRLWKEQLEQCVYSGKNIGIEDLQFNRVEIDHILPISRSGDDSLMNKVLVFSSENQNKGNKTAFEYLEAKGNEQLLAYQIRVKNLKTMRYPKKERLLLENFDDRKSQEYKSRHLNDTRYIARALTQHIDKNIRPANQKYGYVQTIAGRATTTIRKLWQMGEKNRQESHKHHALDAILIAGMGNSIKNWEKMITTASHYKNKDVIPSENVVHNINRFGFNIDQPWNTFSTDARNSVENIFVSRMGKRKISGAMHADTIKSRRLDNNVIKTIKLHEIDKTKWNEDSIRKILDNMIDKERNQRVYDIILKHAQQLNWNMFEAFKDDNAPNMPTNNSPKADGSEKIIPKIRRIKVYDSASSSLQLPKISSNKRMGAVDSGDIVRLDLFKTDLGFYCEPLYAFHYNSTIENLPSPPKEINGIFIFSIYKNDYLSFESDLGFKINKISYTKCEGYFVTRGQSADLVVDKNTGVKISGICKDLILFPNDANSSLPIRITPMKKITKYYVDILGKKHFIASSEKPEMKRLTLKEVEALWKIQQDKFSK